MKEQALKQQQEIEQAAQKERARQDYEAQEK